MRDRDGEPPEGASARLVSISCLLVPRGEQALLLTACGSGGKEAVLLAAIQPHSQASWDSRDPTPPPLDKHSVFSQDRALEVKEQMWKGRGGWMGRTLPLRKRPADSFFLGFLRSCSWFLTAPLHLSLSPWGGSGTLNLLAGQESRKEGQGVE